MKDERYGRQIIIPEWGRKCQEKLSRSTVFIAGAGGLGSPAALYLAAAGVGTIRICDNGILERSNLNRQILYQESDIGKPKVFAAEKRLSRLNSTVAIVPVRKKITEKSIEECLGEADLIIDCLDNFTARYICNAAAVKMRVPFIHAGISGFSGQLSCFSPPETPCLNCLFPEISDTGIVPVAGPTAGIIGSLEAMEAVKLLCGIGSSLKGRLMIWEGDIQRSEVIEIVRDPDCPVCSHV